MILIYDGTGWSEHEAENIDELLAHMERALETEGPSPARKYKVIEVDVKREVLIERKVSMVASVTLEERQPALHLATGN